MSDRQLVLSFFPDAPAADKAAETLKDSGVISGDAMGILALDSKGNLDVSKVGARSTKAGAGIGIALVILGPAALGVGLVGGAAAGALHHKGLKLTDDDKSRITSELKGGHAAVGVLAEFSEAGIVQERLNSLGGATTTHAVVDEAALAAAAPTT